MAVSFDHHDKTRCDKLFRAYFINCKVKLDFVVWVRNKKELKYHKCSLIEVWVIFITAYILFSQGNDELIEVYQSKKKQKLADFFLKGSLKICVQSVKLFFDHAVVNIECWSKLRPFVTRGLSLRHFPNTAVSLCGIEDHVRWKIPMNCKNKNKTKKMLRPRMMCGEKKNLNHRCLLMRIMRWQIMIIIILNNSEDQVRWQIPPNCKVQAWTMKIT